MSNKKILSVKPTKNVLKFIFETEMSADELLSVIHKHSQSTDIYVQKVINSGLWKNKLFVVFNAAYSLMDVNRWAAVVNGQTPDTSDETREVNDGQKYKLTYDWCRDGSSKWEHQVDELCSKITAEHFIEADKKADKNGVFMFYFPCKNLSVKDPSGKQIWPRETEQKKTYCEVVVAYHSKSLYVTHEDAIKINNWVKRYHAKMCADESYLYCYCTIHDRKCDLMTSVLFMDIKHIYDENGNDMLANGLAKAQKPADVWHVEVPMQSYAKDNKFDLLASSGLRLLDQLQSGKEFVYFNDVNDTAYSFLASDILCLWNNEKTLWTHEDKKPTSFSAPSLLSRMYK